MQSVILYATAEVGGQHSVGVVKPTRFKENYVFLLDGAARAMNRIESSPELLRSSEQVDELSTLLQVADTLERILKPNAMEVACGAAEDSSKALYNV